MISTGGSCKQDGSFLSRLVVHTYRSWQIKGQHLTSAARDVAYKMRTGEIRSDIFTRQNFFHVLKLTYTRFIPVVVSPNDDGQCPHMDMADLCALKQHHLEKGSTSDPKCRSWCMTESKACTSGRCTGADLDDASVHDVCLALPWGVRSTFSKQM